jgi:chemotaxis protein CheD
MRDYKLNIGDVVISSGSVSYTCFGLGSCIGLFIQDRVTGLSGGAHIFLPELKIDSVGETKYYDVISAMEEILNQFKTRGSDLTTLRAKITGGANVMEVYSQTGAHNIASVIKNLTERKIFLAAKDVGGNYYRTARFESWSGLLKVRIPQINQYKTY